MYNRMSGGIVIHQSAIIAPDVILADGVYIGPNVVIREGASIGRFACIGGQPEHKDFFDQKWYERTKGVFIGTNVRIFEMVTVHAGTVEPTQIDAGAAIFNKSHVAHDCHIGKDVIIGGGVYLAGHVRVLQGANVGGRACVHQRCVIGHYSILSAASFLKAHVPPGRKYVGSPARPAGENNLGLERAGLSFPDCHERFGDEFERLTKGVAI